MQLVEQKMPEPAKIAWQPEKLLLVTIAVGPRRLVPAMLLAGPVMPVLVTTVVGLKRRSLEQKMPAPAMTAEGPGKPVPAMTVGARKKQLAALERPVLANSAVGLKMQYHVLKQQKQLAVLGMLLHTAASQQPPLLQLKRLDKPVMQVGELEKLLVALEKPLLERLVLERLVLVSSVA